MDEAEANKHFSVQCFNEVWELLEKESRTPDEDGLLREMAHASLYHWLRRKDCEPANVSIGLWQVSRVHAVLGEAATALTYANECLRLSDSHQLADFYRGYAQEAVARAALLSGDKAQSEEALGQAQAFAGKVSNDEERALLETDLDGLTKQIKAAI